MTEEEIRNVFSKNLKFHREKRSMSQMALASSAGLATNFINDIENGKKWVSPASLSKICKALDIHPYKLFIEINIDDKNNNEIIEQFCIELSNDILQTIKKTSSKYGN